MTLSRDLACSFPGEDALRNPSNKPSWARGNPYAKAFPRAKTWTRRQVSGLSGKQPPSGWEVNVKCVEKREEVSAKDLYRQLVEAAALERSRKTSPAKSPFPATPLTKGTPQEDRYSKIHSVACSSSQGCRNATTCGAGTW